MTDSPALLAAIPAALLALVALLGSAWAVLGRRRQPAPLDGAPIVEAHSEHERRVDAADAVHARTEAEVDARDELPLAERTSRTVAAWTRRER